VVPPRFCFSQAHGAAGVGVGGDEQQRVADVGKPPDPLGRAGAAKTLPFVHGTHKAGVARLQSAAALLGAVAGWRRGPLRPHLQEYAKLVRVHRRSGALLMATTVREVWGWPGTARRWSVSNAETPNQPADTLAPPAPWEEPQPASPARQWADGNRGLPTDPTAAKTALQGHRQSRRLPLLDVGRDATGHRACLGLGCGDGVSLEWPRDANYNSKPVARLLPVGRRALPRPRRPGGTSYLLTQRRRTRVLVEHRYAQTEPGGRGRVRVSRLAAPLVGGDPRRRELLRPGFEDRVPVSFMRSPCRVGRRVRDGFLTSAASSTGRRHGSPRPPRRIRRGWPSWRSGTC